MSEKGTPYIHRRCEKCDGVNRTRAKKSFKCRYCGHVTKITHAKPVKKPKTEKLRRTEIDQFIKDEPRGK